MQETASAQLRYLHHAPRKARLLADTIRGLTVNEAEAQLLLSARRAKTPLLKLLRSASANAKQMLKKEPGELFVKEIRVDIGPRSKRWTPRARGAVNLIEKKMSHITIVLGVSASPKVSRFVFPVKPKKKKEEHAHHHKHEKEKEESGETAAPRGDQKTKKEEPKQKGEHKGFLTRTFRRKAV